MDNKFFEGAERWFELQKYGEKYDVFLWDRYGTKAVRSSRIRNLSIEEHVKNEKYEAVAWITDSSTVSLGYFNNFEEAKTWLDGRLKVVETIPFVATEAPDMLIRRKALKGEVGKMKMASWTVILDDEYYIDMAIRSVAPFVQGIYIQDQGCTDRSIEIIKEVMKEYPNTPYVIEQEFTNLPRHKAVEYEFRAKAIQRCEELFKPDWLVLLDADEIFTEEFFELVNTVDLSNYNGVITSCNRFITPEYKDACEQSSVWIQGKRYVDPHCKFWRGRLGIKFVQNPATKGNLHCVLSPDPFPYYYSPSEGTYVCHLHRSFGPKAFEFWAEGGDLFERVTPFNPRRQAPKWWNHEHNIPSAEKSNFKWPEYVLKKWREWGTYD